MEGKPDFVAKHVERLHCVGRGGREVRTDGRGARHERGGLARGHLKAFVESHVEATLEVEIADLTHDEVMGRRRKGSPRRLRTHGINLEKRLERECQQGVTSQDRGRTSKDRPRGRAVTALGIAIHDVVVQEREVVHELHR